MAFSNFRRLPAETRDHIWKDALDEEAKDRLLFVHGGTHRVMPTQNNVSSIMSVNREARGVALARYTTTIPIYELPTLRNALPLSFEEWIIKTQHVQWGAVLSLGRQTWSNLERYWHHYAMPKLSRSANILIQEYQDGKTSLRGCLYINKDEDRFLISHDVSDRDNTEAVVSYGPDPDCERIVGNEWEPDMCAYQTVFERKATILGQDSVEEYEIQRRHISTPLPLDLRRGIIKFVFPDIREELTADPAYVFGTSLAAMLTEPGGNTTTKEHFAGWMGEDYPGFGAMISKPGSRLLCYEVAESDARTLVGKVEAEGARALRITELDVDSVLL
ncbi:HET-domain-containing protein [Apiospora arundinis]